MTNRACFGKVQYPSTFEWLQALRETQVRLAMMIDKRGDDRERCARQA
jgi:hypothetical protein